MIDTSQVTTAGLPTLLEHLKKVFLARLEKRLEAERARTNKDAPTKMDVLDVFRRCSPLLFLEFCDEYLKTNRITETFAVDSNVGVVLSDLSRCVICPGTEVDGTMLDAGAVAITEGRAARNKEGTDNKVRVVRT